MKPKEHRVVKFKREYETPGKNFGRGMMITKVLQRDYGEYGRMGRFGGWQAQWLASVVMMSGEGRSVDSGMTYQRDVESPGGGKGGAYVVTTGVTSTIYTIGIVDIDEAWLVKLIPDIEQRDQFLKGDKDGFFKER